MTSSKTEPWNEGVIGHQVPPLINSNERFIRVQAGPGTGKTFGLVRRVQRILHPDGLNVKGDEVLVVAFNRVIAKQMQVEVDEMLKKSQHNGKPVIRTVHALCLQAIGGEARLLLPHEREAMIYDILQEHAVLQKEYTTHKKAEQSLRDHEAQHVEHPLLWQAVERWLRRHKARLLSDLPGMLLDSLKVGDVGHDTYAHIIADEYQDLTEGEQELFARLLKTGGNFLALGDPQQSIYKFRGNDINGLAGLEDRLGVKKGDVYDVPMTECQRCPGDIVLAANRLMAITGAPPMDGDKTRKANIHVVAWETPQKEIEGMAKAIVANYKASPKADRHLVMVTRRQFGFRLREEIHRIDKSLRVDLSFSEGLLETWPVREAFLFFCLMTDPDAATWRAWLAYQNPDEDGKFKASKRNAPAYLNLLAESKDNLTEAIMRDIADGKRKIKGEGTKTLTARAKHFFGLKEKFGEVGNDPAEFINRLLKTEQWKEQAAEDETNLIADDMTLLRDKALSLLENPDADEETPSNIEEQLRKVAQRLRYDIAVRDLFDDESKADIQVTTFWSAKGVTANHVYVLGLTEQTIPGTRKDEYPGTNADFEDEQRRLFYVSITRSKNTLVLSRSLKIKRSDALRLGFSDLVGMEPWAKLSMSPYLRDIIKFLPQIVPGDEWEGCVPK